MTTTTWLACVQGCPGRHDAFSPLFECPSCGGLVDVHHDVDAWRGTSASSWKALLDARAASVAAVDRSGVWAHREWVMPQLAVDDVVTMGEGRAPLEEIPALARRFGVGRLLVKQCGTSATGSFKDLGMTVLVSMASAMKKRGRDVRALVCASTGDTSAALAAYGARAGLPVVVLLPAGKVSNAQLVQPVAHGAKVLALDGDFDACMGVVAALAKRPGVFLANSKNPLRLEGQKTVAFEIARELGWRAPDFVLVPSGNLGNVAALHAGFTTLKALGLVDRLPRLVACQVDAANPLYRASTTKFAKLEPLTAADTHASAIRIGAPVSFPRAKKALLESDGLVTSTSEAALLEATAHGDRCGLFVDPHTAVALASLAQLPDRAQGTCVVVSTAHGLKFADQKTRFHEGSTALGDLALPPEVAALRNPPRRVPATIDAVVEAIG